MGILNAYKIDLLSRELQGQAFEWDIDDSFFSEIDGLVKRGSVHVNAECLSAGTINKFIVRCVGNVVVPCDRCLADLELRIETEDVLSVKLGDDYSDDGDCVVVPEAEGYLDLAQFIYEFIVLSMPITCQHEPGKCDDAMMQTLSMHQAARSGQEDEEDVDSNGVATDEDRLDEGVIDSRWAALAKLKTKN